MSSTDLSPTPLPKRELYFVFGALMLGMLLAALDQTIVSTALPTIVGDLHGANHLSWVVVAYLLASTVSTPLWGKLGDLFGRKIFFQTAIVIFLAGSMLCGLAHSMIMLILFRAIQGLGGGGLIVGAQSVIADIVPPRERGRYAGWFGGVFGAATVLGPLLGGVIVEYWSWRWIFFVNVPFGILALIVTAAALPAAGRRVSHVIDYAGILTLTAGASGLILYLSLGGTSIAWSSPLLISFLVGGVVFTAVFVFVERASPEPILAPRLFRNRAFVSGSAIGFIVGFAMFGAMTFLPLFFQEVRGVSPTSSGLRLLPLMVGLFGASIVAGQLVAKGWRYRPFPIAGTAIMTVGLALMSLVGVTTSSYTISLYMFVLGVGLGLVMQILVTAVQNAVDQADLGAATAGANFFRSIGGSFGTAVFGALYANEYPRQLLTGFGGHLPAGFNPAHLTPKALHQLPPAQLSIVLHSITNTLQHIYKVATPIGVLAVLASLTLPEIKLRTSLHPVAEEIPMSNADPLSG
ncbi:MAG TPA: MDR family MFS transporter [Acidimicrobiales bacterium]|nr:MDR family MFS transporter [Acidimicrobiales bacterium]